MVNGAAVALQLTPAKTSAPAAQPSEIEREIGAAMANAVAALSQGWLEYLSGKIQPETREAGGAAIATLYQLSQNAPAGVDFANMAHREGQRTLRAKHDAAVHLHGGVDFPETEADEFIDHALHVVSRVAAHMAN